jgi:hypothetical protein
MKSSRTTFTTGICRGTNLLEIQSPFVVDYLRRSSKTEIAHADLLWRYYAHYSDFWSAAEVQYELAQSDFTLSLDARIQYLSRAKANASARTTGFTESSVRNRQSRQELLRSIGDLLDVANIQHDVLQKMKDDTRLRGESREKHLTVLDGKIMPLDEVGLLFLLLPLSSSISFIFSVDTTYTNSHNLALPPVRRSSRLLRPLPSHLPRLRLPLATRHPLHLD